MNFLIFIFAISLKLYAADGQLRHLGFVDIVEKDFIKCGLPAIKMTPACNPKFELFEEPDVKSKKLGFLYLHAFGEEKVKVDNFTKARVTTKTHAIDWIKPDGTAVKFVFDEIRLGKHTYFHTYIDCKEDWFKLPKNPFATPVWIKFKKEYCSDKMDRLHGINVTLFKNTPAVDIKSGVAKSVVGSLVWDKVEAGYVHLHEVLIGLPSNSKVDEELSDDIPHVQSWYEKIKTRLEKELGRPLNDGEKAKTLHSAKLYVVEEYRLKPEDLITARYKVKIEDLLDDDLHAEFIITETWYQGDETSESYEFRSR